MPPSKSIITIFFIIPSSIRIVQASYPALQRRSILSLFLPGIYIQMAIYLFENFQSKTFFNTLALKVMFPSTPVLSPESAD